MFPTGWTPRRLALVGIVGPIVWWILIVVNGAITPGYNHVTDFISTLGGVGAPYALLQRLNFVVFGGSILAAALGVHRWYGDGTRPRVATGLVAILGIGVVLAGVFPEDPASPGSMTDSLHTLVSMIAFLGGIFGVSLLSRRFAADDRWPTVRYEAIGTVLVVFVSFVVAVGNVIVETSVIGITQRLFLGVLTLWVVGQSIRLYRLADPGEYGTDVSRRADSPTAKSPK